MSEAGRKWYWSWDQIMQKSRKAMEGRMLWVGTIPNTQA